MDSLRSTSFPFVFNSSFVSLGVSIYVQYFLDAVRNQYSNSKYLLELIKRKSKVHQKNKSLEGTLNYDHLKTFSENY